MKLRIRTFSDCFEGRQFVIQKRVLFIFWVDCSGWFSSYQKAEEEMNWLRMKHKEGLSV